MGLTSHWFVLAAAVLALAAVAAVPWTWDRWRRPAPARSALVVLAVSAVLLAVGAFVNAQAGFYPSVSSVLSEHGSRLAVGQDGVAAVLDTTATPYDLAAAAAAHRPGHGVVVSLPVAGPRSGVSRQAAVYLPDAYFDPGAAGVRYPAIEVLSGSPGNPGQMLTELRLAAALDDAIAAHRMAPTVVVVPDTNGSLVRDRECVDKPGGVQDETYLGLDVPQQITARFRVLPGGGSWGVTGTSTGGYCALDMLLRTPDRYAAAAGLSPYVHALTDPTTGRLYASAADRDAHDPVWRAQHLPLPARAVWLSAGTGEPGVQRDVAEFAALPLAPLRLTTVSVAGGGHTFTAWRDVLPQALAFLSAQLPPPTAPTPPLPGQRPVPTRT